MKGNLLLLSSQSIWHPPSSFTPVVGMWFTSNGLRMNEYILFGGSEPNGARVENWLFVTFNIFGSIFTDISLTNYACSAACYISSDDQPQFL